MTLDPNNPNTTATGIAVNPNNWTQFANLLYIDAPATGFSYPLGYHDSTGTLQQPSIGNDVSRDAGIFLQILARFLMRHPALLDNQVILVPESYSGARATLMLYYLYGYLSLNTAGSSYYDPQLYQDLTSYLSLACPGQAPYLDLCIPSRFNHQIMIEPTVAGNRQNDFMHNDQQYHGLPKCATNAPTLPCQLAPPCDPNHPSNCAYACGMLTCDGYNADKPVNWAEDQEDAAAVRLNNVANLTVALGVDPTTILWMHSTYRQLAYGRLGSECGDSTEPDSQQFALSTSSMKSTFNSLTPLAPDDCYFVSWNPTVAAGYPGASKWDDLDPTKSDGYALGATVAYAFLANLYNNVATFITVAEEDQVVWSPSIPEALNNLASPMDPNHPTLPNPYAVQSIENLVSSVTYNQTASNNPNGPLSNPGLMQVNYTSNGITAKVTMPTGYLSGHTVPMRAPDKLLSDVMQWYADH